MVKLKFRAWDEIRQKYFTDPKWVEFSVDPNGVLTAQNYKSHQDHTYQKLVIEQFTGLFDKNGVEIYAGDIMHDPEDDENPYQVVWCEQSAQWQTHCEESESCSVFEMSGPLVEFAPSDVVIGNIHQHADLLKGE